MVWFIVSDVVAALETATRSISFDGGGDPPVQQRPKITYRGRSRPVYYDPSAPEKRDYKAEVRSELMSTGITEFPLFVGDAMSSSGISITLTFFFYLAIRLIIVALVVLWYYETVTIVIRRRKIRITS
jgi:hypothetical protein